MMATSRHQNPFLATLEYPKDQPFPFPTHDTGVEVTATVYDGNPWDEDDKSDEPFEVTGPLLIRPSPFGGFQCFVRSGDEELDVAPETVKPVSK